MWLGNLFRSLFLLIDGVVYWAVNILYQLFIMISETGIFTPENIKTFGSRIYVLLGVFMLFKVSFSFINYILNPDTFSDKSKGVNKLLMNFFVVLIGIVAVPYIFQAAYSLQAIVLRENVIGSLVMGMNAEVMNNNDYDYIEQGGKLMSYTTLSAFIRLKPDIVGEECAANPVVAVTDENGPVYENGVRKAELNPACALGDVNGALEVKVNGSTVGETLVKAYSENNTNYFTLTGLVNATVVEDGEETWIFDYSIILSTIAGGFLAWILLMFCFDVATRSVKLGFLQLIAPIPIISYIDPKNGKDGIFKKWTKECTGTYLSLFVRLLAIYFVLFIITIIINSGIINVVSGEKEGNIFVVIFIIFGALMFAKELPKLISDITGVKLDGGFTLSLPNRLQQVPLAGWGMTQLAGRTAGAIESALHDQTGNKGRAALAGWFGAGDALHGKVPLMGTKAGNQAVRGIHIGRQAGYKIATGSEMKTHMPFSAYFAKGGKEQIKDLKDNYRAPLQQELNHLNLQKQEAANAYNKLNEQLQSAKTEQERAAIRAKMQQAQQRYQEIAKKEAKVSGDIGTINDQIKDLERAYNIDKSPVSKLTEVKDNVTSGSYHTDFPPIEYNVPTSSTPSQTQSNNSPGTTRVTVRKRTNNNGNNNQ